MAKGSVRNAVALLLVPVGLMTGCGASAEQGSPIAEQAGGRAGAEGEAGGAGGASGAGAAGSAGSGGAAGSGGVGPTACAGLAGPEMVAITTPKGGTFCIDRTEVTQGQYAKFLTSVTTKPGSEHPECGLNASYAPKLNPPGSSNPPEPSTCTQGKAWTPDVTPNRPVVCVDWCDAYAYCAWAGKRLCGKVGGGPGTVSPSLGPSDPGGDANESQWYSACSQGGKTVYPYGNSYEPKTCDGFDAHASGVEDGSTGTGSTTAADVASRPGCRGGAAPYASVYDLSGSVMEFTDEWADDNTGVARCMARGGSFVDDAPGLRCDTYAGYYEGTAEEAIGFRCCKDLQ